MRYTAPILLATALLGFPMPATSSPDPEPSPEARQERLWTHRNLGKAFYENPATQYDAVEELREALELAPDSVRERINYGLALLRAGRTDEGVAELEKARERDPSIPHTWFNLGIAYKREGLYEEAIRQLEGMAERVPDEAITRYNLGVLYKLEGRPEAALDSFELAARLDPDLAGVHFQLANVYRQAGRTEEATAAMTRFRELKSRKADDPIPEDLEWSWYSELYDPIEPVRTAPGAAELAFEALPVEPGEEAGAEADPPAGLVVVDANGDRAPDLLSWSGGRARLRLGGTRLSEAGLAGLGDVHRLVPGDFDDDGLVDLVVLGSRTVRLLRNTGGAFAPHPAELPAGRFHDAVWLDYDHDYDEDLVLLGPVSRLLRNQGEGAFADRTADFPFVPGEVAVGIRLDLVADSQAMDLVVAYRDRSGVLYRDRLGGKYEARDLDAIPAAAADASLLARDVDRDGWTDLVAGDSNGARILRNDQNEGFAASTLPSGGAPLLLADLENRGVPDLLAGTVLYRLDGVGGLTPTDLPAALDPGENPPTALEAADFDRDGRLDVALLGTDPTPRIAANRTATGNRWLAITLEGVKNLRLAPGAEVEVKAGPLYQKRTYRGVPLHFGLADRESVDAVRITWPNGLIQNETRQPAGSRPHVEEAPRLSGSCPMIFSWNGREFEFLTDVLGVAPLGASAGDGTYFPVDHDEAIQIPGSSLAPREDGRYEIRITEELREVAFLDEIRLIAVDHPPATEILTNQKFQAPPYPPLRLFSVTDRFPPTAARDHRGRDVLERVLERDRAYPDAYDRDFSGVAELHHLELELPELPAAGSDERTLLVLSGWVDWADGSTFLATSQGDGPGLVMPRLLVSDESGGWTTALEDLGIPAGKPKTIVADLTDALPTGGATVRIETSLVVYWDEIYLARAPARADLAVTSLYPSQGDLRFRGFSRVEVHPERKQPERFVYDDVRPTAMWNPTPGLYTRFGDVTELLTAVDDRFVVMGAGDELRLLFERSDLPSLPAGWTRDYLLHVDGWAKDGDANTAYSQTVEPLPFHAMPQYPYADPHRYPETAEHLRYRETWLTRPALRPIRPLTEGTARDPRGRAGER